MTKNIAQVNSKSFVLMLLMVCFECFQRNMTCREAWRKGVKHWPKTKFS